MHPDPADTFGNLLVSDLRCRVPVFLPDDELFENTLVMRQRPSSHMLSIECGHAVLDVVTGQVFYVAMKEVLCKMKQPANDLDSPGLAETFDKCHFPVEVEKEFSCGF